MSSTVKAIAELSKEVIAGFKPKPEERKKHGKYLLLDTRNIKDGVLTKTDHDFYVDDLSRDSFRPAIALPGDIIVPMLFDTEKLYVFRSDDPPAVVANSYAIIRSSQSGDYILSYLRTLEGKHDFLGKTSKVTRDSIIPLSEASLASIQIPILPIAELSRLSDVRIEQSTDIELILLKHDLERDLESENAEIKKSKDLIKNKQFQLKIGIEIINAESKIKQLKLKNAEESKNAKMEQRLKQDLDMMNAEMVSANREIKACEAQFGDIERTHDKVEWFYQNRIRKLELQIESQIETNVLASKVKHGETANLEFKSSLRLNMHTKQYDKKIEKAVMKTIAAFCNTRGGELLIGIADNGDIVGIEHDGFPNADKFQLHLGNLIHDRLTPNIADLIEYEMVILNGKMVCHITCKPSSNEIWFKADKNASEQFFVRSGPSSKELSPKEAVDYINTHFK